VKALRGLLFAVLFSCGCAAGHPSEAHSPRAESPSELASRAEAAAASGDATRAEQYFAAALQVGGEDPRIVQRLLAACVSDRRYPAAIQYAERYLRHHPDDPEIGFAAASLQLATGNFARARELLEALIARVPGWPEPHFALASVLREQGEDPADAELQDLEYLQLAPRGPLAEAARSRLRRTQ
jgi:tetratricopeptide (TPR) repeat protein